MRLEFKAEVDRTRFSSLLLQTGRLTKTHQYLTVIGSHQTTYFKLLPNRFHFQSFQIRRFLRRLAA